MKALVPIVLALGCAPFQTAPASVGSGTLAAAPSTDAPVQWRVESWPELGLHAQVFSEAPTNKALYVRLCEWRTAAGETLRIQIDNHPELATEPLRPLAPQERWQSGKVEAVEVCGRQAQRLRVTRDGFLDPTTKVHHLPLREVRVRLQSGGQVLAITWSVESARPDTYRAAEATFFSALRCQP